MVAPLDVGAGDAHEHVDDVVSVRAAVPQVPHQVERARAVGAQAPGRALQVDVGRIGEPAGGGVVGIGEQHVQGRQLAGVGQPAERAPQKAAQLARGRAHQVVEGRRLAVDVAHELRADARVCGQRRLRGAHELRKAAFGQGALRVELR